MEAPRPPLQLVRRQQLLRQALWRKNETGLPGCLVPPCRDVRRGRCVHGTHSMRSAPTSLRFLSVAASRSCTAQGPPEERTNRITPAGSRSRRRGCPRRGGGMLPPPPAMGARSWARCAAPPLSPAAAPAAICRASCLSKGCRGSSMLMCTSARNWARCAVLLASPAAAPAPGQWAQNQCARRVQEYAGFLWLHAVAQAVMTRLSIRGACGDRANLHTLCHNMSRDRCYDTTLMTSSIAARGAINLTAAGETVSSPGASRNSCGVRISDLLSLRAIIQPSVCDPSLGH